jgi:hypothetical protein
MAVTPPVFGSHGLTLLRAVVQPDEPINGYVTGAEYPFHERVLLYVDDRDVVFLLGPEYMIDD